MTNRQLVYKFFELPYVIKMQIVTDLGLVEAGDSEVLESARMASYFKRATDQGKMQQFVDRILGAGNHD